MFDTSATSMPLSMPACLPKKSPVRTMSAVAGWKFGMGIVTTLPRMASAVSTTTGIRSRGLGRARSKPQITMASGIVATSALMRRCTGYSSSCVGEFVVAWVARAARAVTAVSVVIASVVVVQCGRMLRVMRLVGVV